MVDIWNAQSRFQYFIDVLHVYMAYAIILMQVRAQPYKIQDEMLRRFRIMSSILKAGFRFIHMNNLVKFTINVESNMNESHFPFSFELCYYHPFIPSTFFLYTCIYRYILCLIFRYV